MDFKVGVGKSDFDELIKSGDYYVDKTELLYELVNDTDNKVTLFTRPRRFGKTLMMSMMENFFSIRKNSKSIFEGLAIRSHEDFCKEWMNQYPVLFMSFKDVEAEDFNGAYKMLISRLADVCKGLTDINKNELVNPADRDIFERLMYKKAEEDEIKNSIKMLMRMLSTVYGKKVILLIDEYDVPLAKASEKDTTKNGYYSGMLDVIKGIMSTALKNNEFLQFAVITGCLRIAKESIFTGINNFASYSVLDERFSRSFGFLEDEVETMLAAADRREAAAEIRKWYDGYVFGNSYLYCPWDVINHISALRYRRTARPKNYWKNTSHNGILLTFVKRTDFKVRGKFEILMNSGTIRQTITDELTYDTMHSSEDNLWSVLLMTGYITKADAGEEGETVSLKIPNREIASIFEDTVVKLFKETIDTNMQKKMMEAFWNQDTEEAGRIVSELLWKTISYNDYHEDYYHAFLAGIFVGRGYEVESNKEKGLGRPDILLKDEDNRRAIIIEAKKSDKETDLDKDCDEAIDQIIAEKYGEGLYGYEQILCYGVAFFQKQAKVKLLKA
ncbi:MAG TPA: hypothetical protein DCL38_01570 [Lachnospiraceae bacterium]|nr:hypothetical protein [Lachnospiraceae bacterium]